MTTRSKVRSFLQVGACALSLAALIPSAQAAQAVQPLPVDADFDIAKFAGDWVEVARTASFGRRLCTDSVASFTTSDFPNTLQASFTCQALHSPQVVSGVLSPRDDRYPATLLFTWSRPPVTDTDFHVLAVAEDYSWALVGERGRKNAYIYAREAAIDPAILRTLIIRLDTDFDYVHPEESMFCTMHNGAPVPGCAEVLDD